MFFFSHMNLDSCLLNILTFDREEVMKHIPPRCYRGLHTDWKVTVWDSSIDPLPHQPTKNTGCAPSLWLSIFHLCTLSACPSCLLCLIITIRETLKSPVDTASSTASAWWRRGFTALFWPGVEVRLPPLRVGGDIPRLRAPIPKQLGPPVPRYGLFISCPILVSALIKFFFSLSHWSASVKLPQLRRKGTPTTFVAPPAENRGFLRALMLSTYVVIIVQMSHSDKHPDKLAFILHDGGYSSLFCQLFIS